MNITLYTYPKSIDKTPLNSCFFDFFNTADGNVVLLNIYTKKRNEYLLSYDDVLKLNNNIYYLKDSRNKHIAYRTIKGMFNKLLKELNNDI